MFVKIIFTLSFLTFTLQMPAFFIAAGSCPVCIEHPIRTPYKSSYSISDMQTLGVSLPSRLPDGNFVLSVEFCGRHFVFIFIYKDTAPCRDTESSVHESIARTSRQPISVSDLLAEIDVLEKTNIGGHYLFPQNPPNYVLLNGEVVTKIQNTDHLVLREDKVSERERSQLIVSALISLSHVKSNNLVINDFCSKRKKRACQFTGGGDIYVSKAGSEAGSVGVVQLDQEQSSCTASPLRAGEARLKCCLELKNQRAVDLQLKANLMLAVCHNFLTTVCETRFCNSIRQVKKLSGYGLSFGTETDCIIYKLELDFENNKCTYYERFRYHCSMGSTVIINAAISYILNRVSVRI